MKINLQASADDAMINIISEDVTLQEAIMVVEHAIHYLGDRSRNTQLLLDYLGDEDALVLTVDVTDSNKVVV